MRLAYSLTPKGEALLPVLQEMCRWANAHVPGTWTAPESSMTRRAGWSLEPEEAFTPSALYRPVHRRT